MKILITGTDKGLGQFLKKKIPNSISFNRKTNQNIFNKKFDYIIHCAFNNSFDMNNFQVLENLTLTKKIANQNSKKIFLSTTRVYSSKTTFKSLETEKLYPEEKIFDDYVLSKILSEKMFDIRNDLIIRLGTIIGPTMRKSSLYKLYHKYKNINISKKSKHSLVHYDEIFTFIKTAIERNLAGIYNFCRNDAIKIEKLVKRKNVKFGKFYFHCKYANTSKISKYIKLNLKSSEYVFSRLMKNKL